MAVGSKMKRVQGEVKGTPNSMMETEQAPALPFCKDLVLRSGKDMHLPEGSFPQNVDLHGHLPVPARLLTQKGSSK